MRARLVIDDITAVPHPFEFRGKEYDLQKSFTVAKAIKEYTEKDDFDELEYALFVLAAMINDDMIRKGDTSEKVTVEMLGACIPPEQYSDVQKYLAEILGIQSDDEAVDDPELDGLIDEQLPDEVKN